ncbi:unnamed protein product [Arabidopsis halleri]
MKTKENLMWRQMKGLDRICFTTEIKFKKGRGKKGPWL